MKDEKHMKSKCSDILLQRGIQERRTLFRLYTREEISGYGISDLLIYSANHGAPWRAAGICTHVPFGQWTSGRPLQLKWYTMPSERPMPSHTAHMSAWLSQPVQVRRPCQCSS